ncbi:MAG: NUDIX hydrolase [Elusimicrobia bacterium]|nr:NUDIX hydrolase [Elusimicrobiota bacterium]
MDSGTACPKATGPRVAVDIVIFMVREGRLKALLIKRGAPPFQGRWALPGGFLKEDEGLDEAARRELREETGVADVYLEQLYTFGNPRRDPRGRVLSVSYFALLPAGSAAAPPAVPLRRAENSRAFGDGGPLLAAGGDAEEAAWSDAYDPPQLAFDHAAILDYARQRLRWKLDWTTVGFGLVPSRFTLTELQRVFEAVLGKRLDKRNFRRKVLALGVLRPTKGSRTEGLTRPARLFEFSAAKFERLRERGVLFPF